MKCKKIFSLILGSSILLISSVSALAATQNVSGGTWNYGISNSKVYSNYYHKTKKHSSSVKNGYNERSYSGTVGANKTSYASIKSHWSAIDYSYYQTY